MSFRKYTLAEMNQDERYVALLFFPLLALVIGTVLFCFGPGSWGSKRTNMAFSNKLNKVTGEVEILVPAEREPKVSHISPGGDKLLVFVLDGWVMLNLVDGTESKVKLHCFPSDTRWLNDELFIAEDDPLCYDLVNARSLSSIELERKTKETLEALKEPGIEMVYDIRDISGGNAFIVLGNGFEYAIFHGLNSEETEALLEGIQHVTVPRQREYRKVDSPDGRFYARRGYIVEGYSGVQIFTSDGTLIARAYKKGWSHVIKGWVCDSSGVIFELQVETSQGPLIFPWVPIFKLLVPGAEMKGRPAPIGSAYPSVWSCLGLVVLAAGGYILVVVRRWWEDR